MKTTKMTKYSKNTRFVIYFKKKVISFNYFNTHSKLSPIDLFENSTPFSLLLLFHALKTDIFFEEKKNLILFFFTNSLFQINIKEKF